MADNDKTQMDDGAAIEAPRSNRMPLVAAALAVVGASIAAYIVLRPPPKATAKEHHSTAPVDDGEQGDLF